MRGAPFRWWVAGGWAIDLFVGRTTRGHKDVEVTVLRTEAQELQQWFANWELWYVPIPGGLRPWARGEQLVSAVHEIWGRGAGQTHWQMEMLLESATPSGDWSYRRDPRITLPIEQFSTEINGLPVVRPEIALLYKSKGTRPDDEADFEMLAPLLDTRSRRWLVDALITCGTGTTWLPRLHTGNP